jgi:uncharacterized membrane protein YdjX (TVP38/TMEM64 family)
MDHSDEQAGKPGAARLLRLLPLVAVAGALALFFALDLQRYFTLEALRENREALAGWVAANPVLAMTLFVAAYGAAVAISFPGASIMTVFGGFLFGLWPGLPLIVTAATAGGTIIFLAAKSALGDTLRRKASGFVSRMEKGFREDELSYLFFLRLAPVFPFWAVNIAAGVLGIRLRTFVIATLFGIIPGTFVYASIGNAASAAFDAGDDVTLKGTLLKFEILLPLVGLALLALLPILLKRLRRKSASEEA